MKVFRLAKSQFCTDLSGNGAKESAGRWNLAGIPMIYTSGSRALCMAELSVHLPLGLVPVDYMLITIEVPDQSLVLQVEMNYLPKQWKAFPPSIDTQQIGSDFVVEGKHLVLKVPSAVVQGEYNYLLNPNHPSIETVQIVSWERFSFDMRLFVDPEVEMI